MPLFWQCWVFKLQMSLECILYTILEADFAGSSKICPTCMCGCCCPKAMQHDSQSEMFLLLFILRTVYTDLTKVGHFITLLWTDLEKYSFQAGCLELPQNILCLCTSRQTQTSLSGIPKLSQMPGIEESFLLETIYVSTVMQQSEMINKSMLQCIISRFTD